MYQILPQDGTLGNTKLVNQEIDGFKKERQITNKTANALKTSALRTPCFCITPKIYTM